MAVDTLCPGVGFFFGEYRYIGTLGFEWLAFGGVKRVLGWVERGCRAVAVDGFRELELEIG